MNLLLGNGEIMNGRPKRIQFTWKRISTPHIRSVNRFGKYKSYLLFNWWSNLWDLTIRCADESHYHSVPHAEYKHTRICTYIHMPERHTLSSFLATRIYWQCLQYKRNPDKWNISANYRITLASYYIRLYGDGVVACEIRLRCFCMIPTRLHHVLQ